MARRARSSPDLPPLQKTQLGMTPVTPAVTPAVAPAVAPAVTPAAAPKVAPPPAPPVEPAVVPMPAPTPTPNPVAIIESLPHDVQEQLFGILRASLDATLLPVREKQRELEAKLAWLHQENERAKVEARSQPQQPVAAPVAAAAASPAPPVVAAAASVAPPRAAMPSVDITASVAPKAAVIETSFGLVVAPPTSLRRPSIELALENVGPVDVSEFSRGRVSAGAVLVALLLAGVAAAIAAMALSYT
jgi:hypothetical protein